MVLAGPICGGASAVVLDFQLACELGSTCGAGDFFFDHPEALDSLNFAASVYSPLEDSLDAIAGASVTFSHPDTGATGFGLSNFSVAADTVTIYVGGRDLPGNQVGVAAPGGPIGSFARGQGTITGSLADDFSLWGGSISFDTKNTNGTDRNWHFDPQTSPGPGQTDFLSVAWHELGHIFGFGTSDSFENLIAGGEFLGASAVEIYGTNVPVVFNPVSSRHEHWGSGLTSPPYADEPDVAFDAALVLGRRTLVTPLDVAALDDLGWEVPSQMLGLHGDADADGDVDGIDFLAWQRGVGTAFGATAAMGDVGGGGAVDDFDLWLWSQHYGATLAEGNLSANQIPEPTAWGLFVVGLMLLSKRRVVSVRRTT